MLKHGIKDQLSMHRKRSYDWLTASEQKWSVCWANVRGEERMANQRTSAWGASKPLAFTVCKLELRRKAIVLLSLFRCTHFRPVVNNNAQNKRKAMWNKPKRNWGAITNFTLNNEIYFAWKKEKMTKVAPQRFGVTLNGKSLNSIVPDHWLSINLLLFAKLYTSINLMH